MKHKKSHGFLKKMVVFCVAFLVLYTGLQLYLSYKLGFELSATLTTCVYAAFSTELGLCCLNRIFVKEDKADDLRNQESEENTDCY